MCIWHGKWLGVEITIARYRSCAPPSNMRSAQGQLLGWGIVATGVLVETLLDRGADGDVAEAEAAIDRLAAAPADEAFSLRDIGCCGYVPYWHELGTTMRLTRDLRDRYRDMAKTLGFEGHIEPRRRDAVTSRGGRPAEAACRVRPARCAAASGSR